ncbi:helix-turn-helix domain-containing protein [Aquimarina hainanensis]|uniref:Helix-turn-helix domain-containing protein n=1 Tax=Aquimarina hainanensis TaxID=1578017 RepID=A0ABW5N5R3_9FLAO
MSTFRVLFFFLFAIQSTIAQYDAITSNKTIENLLHSIRSLEESEVDEITSLSKLLYKTAFEKKDTDNMIIAMQYLSTAALNSGENKLAIQYIDNAINIARDNGLKPQILINLITLKGNHYFDIEEYDHATTIYYEALSIAKKTEDTFLSWALNANLQFIKLRTGDAHGALEGLQQSEQTIPNIRPRLKKRNLALVLARKSEAYILLNQLDNALLTNNRGIAIAKEIKNYNIHIDLLMHRGLIYMKKKAYPKALTFLKQAKELSHEANDIVFLGKILNFTAECFYESRDYQKSIASLEEALPLLTKKYRNSDELSKCYKLLGMAHKKSENIEKSNTYYELYILSLSKLNNKKSTVSQKLREATIAGYEGQINSLQQQKKQQQNRRTYSEIALAIAGAGLLTFSFFFIHIKKRNQKKFNALLSRIEQQEAIRVHKNDQIESTSKQIEKSSLTESHDINESLHKNILKGLEKLEQQEYFLNTDCNLYNVAKKINTNTSYLSKVINTHFDKNFHAYINDLRINYAILRLKNDPKFRLFSIKSIAKEVGYKSSDSFSKYFKIHTGLLPSFYIKKLKSQDKTSQKTP